MSDLTTNLKKFFNSEYQSFGKFITEATAHEAWFETVTLFRKGMQKIHENDLTGLDDIKQANEALKNVINNEKYNKEDVTKQVSTLNESVGKLTKDNVKKDSEDILYQVGALYERLVDAGMPALMNEHEFFESEEPTMEEDSVPDSTIPTKTSDTSTGTNPAPVAASSAVSQPVATTPTAATPTTPQPTSQLPTPTTPVSQPVTESVQESAYEHGFNEARKRWKMGDSSKKLSEEISNKELAHKPYSYVKRWQEGFNEGHGFQEQVSRDTNPKMFEEQQPS